MTDLDVLLKTFLKALAGINCICDRFSVLLTNSVTNCECSIRVIIILDKFY